MKIKRRLDELLVERHLADSIAQARALIMAGRVVVEGAPCAKAGSLLPEKVPVRLQEKNPYVSRGGLKLEGALRSLGADVGNRVCMDIGASTGGFTDCLLRHGAQKVYAVDVGAGLLDQRLKNDPRVESIENANFRYFSCESLKGKIQFATIDVSFISIEKILPSLYECLEDGAEVLALVKPQFEALPSETVKGIVKDESIRLKVIENIKRFAESGGWKIKGCIDSPLKGAHGNIEHFLWLAK